VTSRLWCSCPAMRLIMLLSLAFSATSKKANRRLRSPTRCTRVSRIPSRCCHLWRRQCSGDDTAIAGFFKRAGPRSQLEEGTGGDTGNAHDHCCFFPSPQGHEQRRVSSPPQAKFGRRPSHQKILTVVLAQHHPQYTPETVPERFETHAGLWPLTTTERFTTADFIKRISKLADPGPAPASRVVTGMVAFAVEMTKCWLVLLARTVRPMERSARCPARQQPASVYIGDRGGTSGAPLYFQSGAARPLVLLGGVLVWLD
jgi:hypothetical protein